MASRASFVLIFNPPLLVNVSSRFRAGDRAPPRSLASRSSEKPSFLGLKVDDNDGWNSQALDESETVRVDVGRVARGPRGMLHGQQVILHR